jgi:hypothetical protein
LSIRFPWFMHPLSRGITIRFAVESLSGFRGIYRLGIDETNGKAYAGKSSLYSYFSHSGFPSKSQPEGLYEELDNITVIRILILGGGGLVEEVPLLGTKIMFKE